ncbi:hypothetical protein B0H19DRAFT_1073756 [Mycena capillaripes]|nr:hypothetical protein B0H19DRAFT_1073756 [Mycena capillaripes]
MGWVEGGGQNGRATLALYAKYSDAAAAPKLWLHGIHLECSKFQLGQYKDLELRVYWERFDRFAVQIDLQFQFEPFRDLEVASVKKDEQIQLVYCWAVQLWWSSLCLR